MLSIGLKSDETKLVKDYALFPLLLDVLEHDLEILFRSDLKTSELTKVMIERFYDAGHE